MDYIIEDRKVAARKKGTNEKGEYRVIVPGIPFFRVGQ